MLPAGSPSSSGIRLAGATNLVHVMDVRSGKWEHVTPHGDPPSPRAAHAAAAVGTMVVIQVGAWCICACMCVRVRHGDTTLPAGWGVLHAHGVILQQVHDP